MTTDITTTATIEIRASVALTEAHLESIIRQGLLLGSYNWHEITVSDVADTSAD